MNVLDNITRILDPSGKLAREVSKPRTGFVGAWAARDLPEGWVSITYWPTSNPDDAVQYTGPVLQETELTIRLEVYGEPLIPMLKGRRCTITRPEIPA